MFSMGYLVFIFFCHYFFFFWHLQKEDYKMAVRKYRKALKYLDLCWEMEDINEGECNNVY